MKHGWFIGEWSDMICHIHKYPVPLKKTSSFPKRVLQLLIM